MFYRHDMGWWGYAGMGVGMVALSAAVLFGLIAVIIYTCESRSAVTPHRRLTAGEILADRYARGEIEEVEYRQRTAVLHDHSQP